MTNKKWTVEQLTQAVEDNINLRGVIKQLNLSESGSQRKVLLKYIALHALDISHWKRAKNIIKIPLEKILIKESTYTNINRLKKRLIKKGLLINICTICDINSWHGQALTLHLDHINGINDDHRLENLRLLCPNCHSLTSTYCGRNALTKKCKTCPSRINIRKTYCSICWLKQKPTLKPKLKFECIDCNAVISRYSQRCKPCAGKKREQTKINWPSVQELIQRVTSTSYRQVSKELGVSDNAIRKRIRNHS